MSDSLLISLRSYRPRADRDSLEDFITEAFCWLLRRHPALGCHVLKEVTAGLWDQVDLPTSDKPSDWATQVPLDGKRPDMVASWPGYCVLFEHKIWSAVGQGQIETYRDGLAAQMPERRSLVVLITANAGQRNGVADKELCWEDLYKTLKQQADNARGANDERQVEAIEDFLALLLYEGLGPRAPISAQAVRYWPYTKDLIPNLSKAFASLADRDWFAVLPADYKAIVHPNRSQRVAVEMRPADQTEEWAPGFIFGCILDEADHCIGHRAAEPVLLRLIVCFSGGLQRRYSELPSYQAFLSELRQACAEDDQWTLYDHLDDPERTTRPNPHHPLFLETPLMDVLRGTQTWNEQVGRLHDAGKRALSLVKKAPSFGGLREDCVHLLSTPNA